MYKIFNNNFLIVGLLALALTACSVTAKKQDAPSYIKFEQRVGDKIVAQMKEPHRVGVAKMIRNDDRGFAISPNKHALTKEKIEQLQVLLLDDSHYHFDRTKKCVFIPELAFDFEKEENLLLYVNIQCNQIKISSGEKSYILDYDPHAEPMNVFFRDILALLKQEKKL